MVLTHLKSVRFLLADGHGAHEWVTRQLLGKPLALPKPLKQLAGAFWSCLEFTDLPPCCIHMAYRVAKCSGESVHVFPGPAHAQKNYAEQLRLSPMHFVVDPAARVVQIPWLMEGAFIFSLIGALATASLLHGDLPRKERLEHALSGICLLDFGEIMAKDLAKELGVPKKQLWLDSRTHHTLRDLCASVVLAAYGVHGSVMWPRLTEITLEKRFGRLRNQFCTGQMTAADCWRASGKLMRKELRAWQAAARPQVAKPEAMVSDDSFVAAAQRAFNAALRLAVLCSGRMSDDLRSAYATHFSSTSSSEDVVEVEDEDEDEDAVASGSDGEDVENLLKRVRSSQQFCDTEEPTALRQGCPAQEDTGDQAHSSEIAEATKHVIQADEEGDGVDTSVLPKDGRLTLHAALRGHESFDAAQGDLWRLLCWLRVGPQGCDSGCVPDHWKARDNVLSKKMRWHDCLRRELSLAEQQDKLPAQRQSRQAAWVKVAESQHAHVGGRLPPVLSMHVGHVVVVWHEKAWLPAVVLSCWRNFKKGGGTGAQLCPTELPRGSVHSVRGVLLQPCDGTPGLYRCDLSSRCQIFPLSAVGLRLDSPETVFKRGVDGLQVLLTPESQAAIQQVNDGFGGELPEAKKAAKTKKLIEPIVDNFRRNKQGYRLMQQEVARLLDQQAKVFKDKPILSAENEVRFRKNGANQVISKDAFMRKVPFFFDTYFVQVRQKVQFGLKVKEILDACWREMEQNLRYKDLLGLVSQISVLQPLQLELTGVPADED
ncbi:unnamed protein product [Effrenium voratum]|nr:unnamed protein product [Effrenium voratum]